MKTVILGAGVTGLAAAHKTQGIIYEESLMPGGICLSYYDCGYRFEKGGGHWIFGADLEVETFLSQFATLKSYKRNAGVYINKIFPYPIQRYFAAQDTVYMNSLKGRLLEKFGYDQCRLFFYPFNEKYTAGLYNKIAPQDDYKTPTKNTTGYNSEFLYPKYGLDQMIYSIATRLKINYGREVTKIDYKNKNISFANGEIVKYDRLISTLPLNVMVDLLDIPWEKRLPYTSTLVVNIGATKGKNCPDSHWLYTPYSDSGFHRVGFYSNVDKSFAPNNRVALYVEWAFYNRVPDITNVKKELTDWGFIKKVETSSINMVEIAYTWRSIGSKDREKYLDIIKECDITQIGRYGKWKFQGIAESVKDGLSC